MRKMIWVLLFVSTSGAWAASETMSAPSDGTTSTKVGNILAPKKFEDDKRITDLELKAQSGSLSRYSLKFDLGYAGPPLDHLNDANRPNPDNRPGDNRTALSGGMALRYKTSSDTALNFGTGLKWYTPYQAVVGEDRERPKNKRNYDISDPQISFDDVYAIDKTQLRTSLRVSKTTTEDYVQRGQFMFVGVTQAAKYELGTSRVIIGGSLAADFFGYERGYHRYVSKKDKGDGTVSKYYINMIPSVEYKITDKLNFNTSLGYPYQNLRSDGSWWRWNHPLSTWRVGLGWAIKRDIYFNPYVNFFAEKPAFNTASLSFSTVFSIF